MNSYLIFSRNESALNGIVHINPDGEFAFNDTYNICNSDDIAFLILRSKRNELLAETDWRMTADYPYSDQTAWATYRTELRNLPATAEPALDENGNLTNVVWPTPPSEV